MITYIKIDGFKSFQDFEMEFTPLTVIAGPNAAGKSNLFDALRLLSSLATTDKIQKAFREQRGDLLELFTKYDDSTIAERMSFIVEMLVNSSIKDAWGASANLRYTRLRYELTLHRFTNNIGIEDIEVEYEKLDTIKHDTDRWLKIIPSSATDRWRPKVVSGKRQTPYMKTIIDEEHDNAKKVIVPQDGSSGKKREYPLIHATRTILSSFDSVDFKHILAAKEEMRSWRFLQLNPDVLRMPTNKTTADDTITSTGQYLAATLFRIKQNDPYDLVAISQKLHSFIPNFVDVDVIDDIENKQYIIVLKDIAGKLYTSRVLSEGTMRILALCILWRDYKHTGLLCFEEPENGVHPFRIKAMAQLLRDLSVDFNDIESPLRQVIINTHSTIFIKEMKHWLEENILTIAFAQVVNRIFTVNDKKKRMSASKITPVPKEVGWQTAIEFSEQDRKLTLATINEYLTDRDSESSN